MALADWLDVHADRVLARQRAQVDTAKLLATFVAALAASLVGTSFQVRNGNPTLLDTTSLFLLLASIGLTIWLVLADTLREVDHERLLIDSRMLGVTSETELTMLRVNTLAALQINEDVVTRIRKVLVVQLMTSVLVAGASALSLAGIT